MPEPVFVFEHSDFATEWKTPSNSAIASHGRARRVDGCLDGIDSPSAHLVERAEPLPRAIFDVGVLDEVRCERERQNTLQERMEVQRGNAKMLRGNRRCIGIREGGRYVCLDGFVVGHSSSRKPLCDIRR